MLVVTQLVGSQQEEPEQQALRHCQEVKVDIENQLKELIGQYSGEDGCFLSEAHKQAYYDVIDRLLKKVGIFCGLPLHDEIDGCRIVINPKDRTLVEFLSGTETSSGDDTQELVEFGLKLRNSWQLKKPWKPHGWTQAFYGTVYVLEETKTGRTRPLFVPMSSPRDQRLEILLKSGSVRRQASLVRAERKARQKLFDMVDETQVANYELNDAITEVGRSGVWYLVRKGRPTLALRPFKERIHLIGALCLHPMAYYESTWAGALCPTDEIIAHLLFIRGDEYDYWKKANVHFVDSAIAGL